MTVSYTFFADGGVSVINSYVYATALKKAGVDAEMHIFPHGRHGIGICRGDINKTEETKILEHNVQWTESLLKWPSYIGF